MSKEIKHDPDICKCPDCTDKPEKLGYKQIGILKRAMELEAQPPEPEGEFVERMRKNLRCSKPDMNEALSIITSQKARIEELELIEETTSEQLIAACKEAGTQRTRVEELEEKLNDVEASGGLILEELGRKNEALQARIEELEGEKKTLNRILDTRSNKYDELLSSKLTLHGIKVKLQARIDELEVVLKEIGLEQDGVFPKMLHCKVCGARDIETMGHSFNCVLNKALQAKEPGAEDENGKLKEFARRVIGAKCWGDCGLDGLEIEDLAAELGLIVKHTATEKDIDEDSDYEVGDIIYKFSETLKELE